MYGIQRKMSSKLGRYDMKEQLCYLNDWQDDNYVDEKDLQLLYSVYVDFIDYALQKDDTDHYFMEYVCDMFYYCGNVFDSTSEWYGDCEWLSSSVQYFIRNPDVADQEKADVIDIFVNAIKNTTNGLEAINQTKPVVGPIYQRAYNASMAKGQMKLRNRRAGEVAKNRRMAPTGANSDYDSDCDDYYCGDGDSLDEFLCYCYYSCEWYSYDEHVYFLEQTDLENPTEYKYQDKRTWFYQQCTEWGQMFSDNYGRSIFEDAYPVK